MCIHGDSSENADFLHQMPLWCSFFESSEGLSAPLILSADNPPAYSVKGYPRNKERYCAPMYHYNINRTYFLCKREKFCRRADIAASREGAARRVRRRTSPAGSGTRAQGGQCERNGGGIAPNWDLVSIAQLIRRLHQIEHNLASNPYGERAPLSPHALHIHIPCLACCSGSLCTLRTSRSCSSGHT